MAKAKSAPPSEVDLFGEPVIRAERGRGRPAHQRTRESVNRVILGLARGWTVKEVALSIGISVPTLREHYSVELGRRAAARLMMESVQLSRLNDAAEKGNVGAEKALLAMLAKGRIEQLSSAISKGASARAPKAPKLGKKESRRQAAAEVRGRYAPRPAPPSLVN